MSFRTKILGFVALGCVFCTAAAVYVARLRLHDEMTNTLIGKSQAILTRLEASRRFVANQGLLKQTIEDTVRRFPNGNINDEYKHRILNVVPIYASLKIGLDDAKKDNYVFRVAAKEARRKENEAEGIEAEFLDQFEADTSLKELIHHDEANEAIWVMRPVHLSEKDGCLNCHGNPSTSPYRNGKDVLGFPMENWKDGHLHGMFIIKSSTKPVQAAVMASSKNISYWAGGILAAALAVVFLLLRRPIGILDDITKRMKQSADQGLVSSEKLGGAAQSVASATNEQAAGIQETMASMSEMNSMIHRTLDLAKQTQDLATDLGSRSKNGTEVMQGMVTSMESIKQSNEDLKKMVQIINDISIKTNVINEIVFKTQLLSVNASIEAARAGQHGKGFAVVAEEVGNLAQVSGKAAEEIRDMLTKSQNHVQEVVEVTNNRVSEGERVTQEAMKSFVEISDGITRIQSYSQSVGEATNQQQDGISQITAAMTQMDKASQQNSEMANEVSLLSSNMVEQSQELLRLGHETESIVYGKELSPAERQSEPTVAERSPKPKSSPGKSAKVLDFASLKKKMKKSGTPKAPPVVIENGHMEADDEDFRPAA
ncbi:MAG: methyl-accepting chemotaxis protein [Bdellovibrionales bacterium]